jgi:putative FmdB family regulatory protein
MPLYDFRCPSCGEELKDKYKSFSDNSATLCEKCNTPMKVIVVPVGVTFNGPGFYKTDNRKG